MPKVQLNITGKPAAVSLFPLRGLDHKQLRKQPAPTTVGELEKLLAKLPKDLPIKQGFDDGTKLVWFNVGTPTECLEFEDNDGCWDE